MTPEKAKETYRNAWEQWCLCQTLAQKWVFEALMDQMQAIISPGPGPVWDAFQKSLPGYEEFWARKDAEFKDTLLKRFLPKGNDS